MTAIHCGTGQRGVKQVNLLFDFVLNLLSERLEVLLVDALTHPYSSITALDEDPELRANARIQLNREFQALLKAELENAYKTGDQEKIKSLKRRLEPEERR